MLSQRIFFLIPSFGGGGAEKATVQLANYLSNFYSSIEIVVLDSTGPVKQFVSDKIKINDLNCGRARNSILPLIKLLNKKSPDILISSLDHINIIAILAKFLIARNFIVCPTIHAPISQQPLFKNKQLNFFGNLIYKLLLRYTANIIAVSHGIKRDLHLIYGVDEKKIHVLGNAVVNLADINTLRQSAAEPNPIQIGKKFILSIGRLAPEKNFENLIQAYSKISDEFDEDLVILGEGPEREKLIGLSIALNIDRRVHFLGYISNPFPYLINCSAFACTSRYEGLGLALIEALAFGCEIVCTDCPGGVREVLDNGRFGRLVELDNIYALADGLSCAITTNSIRGNELNHHLEKFSISTVGQNYTNFIERISS